jgi:hypothetical protein
MLKRLSFVGALAVFVSVSGTSAVVTQITINEICHFSGARANHAQFASGQLISHASFVSLPAAPRENLRNNNLAGATPHGTTVGAAAEEEIDLGETFILADGPAGK